MVSWKNQEIGNLLKTNTHASSEEDSQMLVAPEMEASRDDGIGLGDIAFVMFLEPPDHVDPNTTIGERVIDNLIQKFSQKPTMVHVEIVMPPFLESNAKKVHFATYLGSHADYQNEYDAISGVDFYLIRNGQRWRCLPVFGKDAISRLRTACDANVGSPYSLMKYPTSSHYFRNYSWIWSDKAMSSGHCATLTARVLRQAGIKCGISHRPPWYSPSSLYASIQEDVTMRLSETEISNLYTYDTEECEQSIESILRGPLSARTMQQLGRDKCIDAIRHLTNRVLTISRPSSSATYAEQHLAERELADAVFKWSLLGTSLE